MDIQKAKEEIKNTLAVYLQKDAEGNYRYPLVNQRPLLLMGPPGVGKTAIVEQAAREAGLPMVAYTMTHHTRQSAVGLPKITERDYCGRHFSVTEYTMSEIIGAVYAAMDRSGKGEGILFLDEINCVSETLAPTMLQFLQNKTFGNHALPLGWVIVAAGNPPEYNKSVRDFDVVTLDRIRLISVEASVEAFLAYGKAAGVHGAVLSFLGLKPEKFYHVSRQEDRLRYVTARGWEDLSRFLQSCEELGLPVEEELVREFLNLEETARDFAAYYALYRKYGRDYGVPGLLAGTASKEEWNTRVALARQGDFTERFTLVNQVLDALGHTARNYIQADRLAQALHECLTVFIKGTQSLEEFTQTRRKALETRRQFGLSAPEELRREAQVLKHLDTWVKEAQQNRLREKEAQNAFVKEAFAGCLSQRQEQIQAMDKGLRNAIGFLTDCFGDGQELTLLLTQITQSRDIMDYITLLGCDSYLNLCDRLQCQKNEQELRQACLTATEK